MVITTNDYQPGLRPRMTPFISKGILARHTYMLKNAIMQHAFIAISRFWQCTVIIGHASYSQAYDISLTRCQPQSPGITEDTGNVTLSIVTAKGKQ